MTTDGKKKREIPAARYRASNVWMQAAIDEARAGIFAQHGGPFGSVIVKDGVIVGRGHNTVLRDGDSTCHGEMNAIRDAEKNLGTYDLTGCVLYTTGEPCNMCLNACLWAKLDAVYYGCTIADNGLIGFRDAIYDEIFSGREKLGDYLIECDREACLKLYDEYLAEERTIY